MGSAGKWVLGLLLLVVGAVFVARAVSSDPESQATVKNNLQADPASVAKENAAAEAAKQKKIASTTAGDVACKKACVEVNEVSNDSITTAKLAPGSVTLSKLAFEVPNLNELENEINARKAAEAQAKVAASDLATATAKNDAAITAAAANGLTAEAAARTAADDDLAKKTAAADADLLSKLNTEITNRGAADDVLQAKLNTEIADRAGAINGLRAELINPNQVAAPIVQINNNEIVASAVTTDKILADTILAVDLATGSVTTDEILNDTVAAIDLANNAVVGRAAGETLTNVKERTLRGERNSNSSAATSAGDLALGTITGQQSVNAGAATGNIARETITGEGDNTIRIFGAAVGNLGLQTVGRNNLVDDAIDNTKIDDNAITSNQIAAGEVKTSDIQDGDVVNSKLRSVDAGGVNGAVSTEKINDGAVTFPKLDGSTQTRINDLETGLAAEIVNRVADVDAEETARIAADAALQLALNTEIADRTAADTALQTALDDEIADREAADTALQTSLDNEVTAREADIAKLLAADPSALPGDRGPNDNDGFVNWDNLENIPTAILDADNKVSALKNSLKTSDGDAPNTGSNQVHWDNLAGVPADLVDGDIDFSELSGVPTSLTTAFSDNALTFTDLSGSIGVTQIAADTVTFTMLDSPLRTRITDLEAAATSLDSRADALEQNFLDLADSTKTTPAVSSKHLTGYTVVTTTAVASAPVSIPAGGVGEMVLTVANITDSDLFTANTSPTTPLPSGVFVTGVDVDALGGLVHVRLFNSTASPVSPANIDWKVRWMDLG